LPLKAPDRDCAECPRLRGFLLKYRQSDPDWHNAPVPSFGSIDSDFLIVGLAPGLRGANRTGRPFTGDHAGDFLYSALIDHGFAYGHYGRHSQDGLNLVGCRVTNAVRCVPPQNKPVAAEVAACRTFLVNELQGMKNLKIILALGGLAHGAILAAFGLRKSAYKFGHLACHSVPHRKVLLNSYHCSRYNTNTGRLNEQMFSDVLTKVSDLLKST
tara:strand:- start:748 stop:1389 length:642 start_codon:yes stop_codon:yes gene_type:complete